MDDDLTYLTEENDDDARTALQDCGHAAATDYVIFHMLICGGAGGLTLEESLFHDSLYHLRALKYIRPREHQHLA